MRTKNGLYKKDYDPVTRKLVSAHYDPNKNDFQMVQIHYDDKGKGTPVYQTQAAPKPFYLLFDRLPINSNTSDQPIIKSARSAFASLCKTKLTSGDIDDDEHLVVKKPKVSEVAEISENTDT